MPHRHALPYPGRWPGHGCRVHGPDGHLDEESHTSRVDLDGCLADRGTAALRAAGAHFALVFGSTARGEVRAGPDLDVAAWWSSDPPHSWELQLPTGVDLVVLHRLPLELAGRIAPEGVVLFDDDPPARVHWVADTRTLWLDERGRFETAPAGSAKPLACRLGSAVRCGSTVPSCRSLQRGVGAGASTAGKAPHLAHSGVQMGEVLVDDRRSAGADRGVQRVGRVLASVVPAAPC